MKTNFILSDQRKAIFIIFLTAFSVRILLVTVFFLDYTRRDSIDYHNIAINVALGNGYSLDVTPPHRPYFFREPVYPLFLASIYKIWTLFGEPSYLESNFFEHRQHPEIMFARYVQALIGALTCVLFFLLLKLVIKNRPAFIIGLLFSFYIPLAAYSAMLMRETVQTLSVLLMAYTFTRFLQAKKPYWLIWFSISYAISNLTLQITIFVPIFAFLFMLIVFKAPLKSAAYSISMTVIMLLCVSPWLIRTYNFYPDIRIVKNLGMSLTFEQSKYVSSLRKLNEYCVISTDSLGYLFHKEWYNIPEYDKFQKSYSGYFSQKADSLQRLINEPFFAKRKLIKGITNLRLSWIEALWVTTKENGGIHERPHSTYVKNKNYLLLVLSFSGFLFGYLAIPGIFLYFRKIYPILLMFIYFMALYYFIGNEPRRMLPIHPFIFMFSCLAIYHLYLKFFKKLANPEIYNRILS